MKRCPALPHVTFDLQTCVPEWQVSASSSGWEYPHSLFSAAAENLSRACQCLRKDADTEVRICGAEAQIWDHLIQRAGKLCHSAL